MFSCKPIAIATCTYNCYVEIVTEKMHIRINLVAIASYLAMSELLAIVDAINDSM